MAAKPPNNSPGKAGKLTAQQIGSLPPKPGSRPRGAPKGSRNGRGNIRHGLRAGSLPKDARYIEVRLNLFRRHLEDAVLAAKGGVVDIPSAAYIQTAVRWERHASLAHRWLTKQYDTLKPLERLQFSREIAKASSERDKAVAALKLEHDAKDAIDAFFSGNNDGDR